MSIDTIDTLHAQHDKSEKWDHDLLMQTILEMMGGPFKGTAYLKLPLKESKEAVRTYLGVLLGTKYEKRVNRILRKIEKAESTKEIILYLGEVILSD